MPGYFTGQPHPPATVGYLGLLGEDFPRRVEGEGGAGAGLFEQQRRDRGVQCGQHPPDGHHRS